MVKKDIVVINPNSNLALCTLWSKKEEILEELGAEKSKINIAGTLYTTYGVNYVLQTLGENPKIDKIIIYGSDRSLSAEALLKVFNKDFSEVKLLFSPEEIKPIIETTEIIDLRSCYENGEIEKLKTVINNLYTPSTQEKREKKNLKVKELEVSSYPIAVSGFHIHETSIFRAWVKIIKQILTYGFEKPSEYKEPQLEVLNLSVSLNLFGKEYTLEEEFFEWIKKEEFEKHAKEITSAEKPKDVEYTYGYRLFAHSLAGNQIERMIRYLAEKPYSRRCISIVVDPRSDFSSEYPPCIGIVQGIIAGDYYHHTVYLRSNDMFRGWPVNMYGQLRLAEYIVERINKLAGTDYKIGTINTFSFSAHIYQHDWANARKVLEKYKHKLAEFVPDTRGNFLIYHKDGKVVIEHRAIDHTLIQRYESSNFSEIYYTLKGLNLTPDHALYLGKELCKAFEALHRGENYQQDKA
jgi:thymidylate synthase